MSNYTTEHPIYKDNYKKYLNKYLELKHQSGGAKKNGSFEFGGPNQVASLRRKSPTESATLFKVGTVKVGNDGNKWIIVKTKNGIRRWSPYKETFDLHELKDFKITVNYSELDGNSKMTIDPQGNVVMDLKSKYIPRFNNKKITLKIDKNVNYEISNYGHLIITFKIKDDYFVIWAKPDKRKYDTINELFKKAGNKLGRWMDGNYFDEIKDHHFGHLVKYNFAQMKKLKPGKYYIVWGQEWDKDYTGDVSIAVLHLEDVQKIDGRVIIIGHVEATDYSLEGELLVPFNGNWKDYPVTGSGSDAILFVKKWRKGFKAPKGLPKAGFV